MGWWLVVKFMHDMGSGVELGKEGYLCGMARITLEGMQFKSHIGVYDYEQLYGNNFEVELQVISDFIDSHDDEIGRTVDYDHLYRIVREVMNGDINSLKRPANWSLKRSGTTITG